jgi:hypothetical protein
LHRRTTLLSLMVWYRTHLVHKHSGSLLLLPLLWRQAQLPSPRYTAVAVDAAICCCHPPAQ